MPFTLQDFRANFTGSGARSSLFEVQLTFPPSAVDGNAARLLTFMCKAADIPESSLGTIAVHYMGRTLKYPGDRTFADWRITVLNDENFAVRDAFERWSDSLNNHFRNLRDVIAAIPRGYCADAIVRQFSKIGGPALKEYKMIGCWPAAVAAIPVAYDTPDGIEEFGVDLAYQWWESSTTS